MKEEIALLNSQLKKANDYLEDMKKTQFSYENLQREREAAGKGSFEFYTGLYQHAFDSLWEYLEPSDENIISRERDSVSDGRGRRSVLSLSDQLLLVLMRLRPGLLEKGLAFRFGVAESTVSR